MMMIMIVIIIIMVIVIMMVIKIMLVIMIMIIIIIMMIMMVMVVDDFNEGTIIIMNFIFRKYIYIFTNSVLPDGLPTRYCWR